ncbi:murein biosynthesis integral membrane protein MurJ [Brevibacillus sp. SYSU BS000544]|uniref:murein biosynthesis integral membrane protein MurJ n=1 Tax=Brevibacillus sp. SYSU BS000544 TaxID=3416443 RepID=UPI003CE56B0D
MGIVKTASMILILTVIGRFLGFIRTIYMSDYYGTGMEADAYFTALTIPMTLFLVVPGALNAVLIPTMRGLLEKADTNRAKLLYNQLLIIITFLFIALTALGIWASPWIISILGLTGAKGALATELLRWMWPSAIFIGLAGVWTSFCNAHQHFFTPTLGSVANGAIVILAFYLFVPIWGIDGIAIGTTLGFVATALVMLPTVRSFGYQLKTGTRFQNDEILRSMGERVVPILIGSAISQATTFLERFLANDLGDGKVAALSYAKQIAQLPTVFFVAAFTLPLFPLLASYVKRGELGQMKAVLEKGIGYLFILLLPMTVGMILYGEQIIRLFFVREGGNFNEWDVSLTTWGLVMYSFGIFALAAQDMLTRAFYALENTRTPVIIGAFGIGLYLLTAIISTPYLDHGGVALSYSISVCFQAVVLYLFLWKKVGQPLTKSFWVTSIKVLIASALMGAAIIGGESLLLGLPVWLHLLIGVTVGAGIYLLTLLVLKEPLLKEIVAKLLRKKQASGAS